MINELSKVLSFIGIDSLLVKDEWRILQSDVIISNPEVRIDHFWREILCQTNFLGDKKYPSLEKLIKAALCLSHGNSDVERGFSISKRVLAEDKSCMSEKVLNERLIIRDSLKKYKNASEVPITKELLKLAKSAHKSYDLYLEEKRRLKEQSLKEKKERERKIEQQKLRSEEILNKKKSIKRLETKIKEIALDKKETQKSADLLLKEANQRLKSAIESNDLAGIRVAQGMLEGAEKLRLDERD